MNSFSIKNLIILSTMLLSNMQLMAKAFKQLDIRNLAPSEVEVQINNGLSPFADMKTLKPNEEWRVSSMESHRGCIQLYANLLSPKTIATATNNWVCGDTLVINIRKEGSDNLAIYRWDPNAKKENKISI